MLIANTKIEITFNADEPGQGRIAVQVNRLPFTIAQMREVSPVAALRLQDDLDSLAAIATRIIQTAELEPGMHIPEPEPADA